MKKIKESKKKNIAIKVLSIIGIVLFILIVLSLILIARGCTDSIMFACAGPALGMICLIYLGPLTIIDVVIILILKLTK